MNLAQDTVEFLRTRWWAVVAVPSAVGIAAVAHRLSESEAARNRRLQEAEKKELRAIASRISVALKCTTAAIAATATRNTTSTRNRTDVLRLIVLL